MDIGTKPVQLIACRGDTEEVVEDLRGAKPAEVVGLTSLLLQAGAKLSIGRKLSLSHSVRIHLRNLSRASFRSIHDYLPFVKAISGRSKHFSVLQQSVPIVLEPGVVEDGDYGDSYCAALHQLCDPMRF